MSSPRPLKSVRMYIPYAWQEPDTVIEIPARKCGRMNVLGFMNRKNDLHPFIFEQSVHTGVVIACFEAFSKTLKKKTVVVMDLACCVLPFLTSMWYS